jgi:hypothetical protein
MGLFRKAIRNENRIEGLAAGEAHKLPEQPSIDNKALTQFWTLVLGRLKQHAESHGDENPLGD